MRKSTAIFFIVLMFLWSGCGDPALFQPQQKGPDAGGTTGPIVQGDRNKNKVTFDGACIELEKPPMGGHAWSLSGMEMNADEKLLGYKVVGYRIKWFSGHWSGWYFPEVNDTDWKGKRRVWSYFEDHHHRYIYCKQAQTHRVVWMEKKEKECAQVNKPASKDPRWETLGLDTHSDQKILGHQIVGYRIHFEGKKWSGWYFPLQNDLIPEGKEAKQPQRMWSHFSKHPHTYIHCKK